MNRMVTAGQASTSRDPSRAGTLQAEACPGASVHFPRNGTVISTAAGTGIWVVSWKAADGFVRSRRFQCKLKATTYRSKLRCRLLIDACLLPEVETRNEA